MINATIRETMRASLHADLADATRLVWLMQNALTEKNDAAKELITYASQLRERSMIILGAVARWDLLEEDAHIEMPV